MGDSPLLHVIYDLALSKANVTATCAVMQLDNEKLPTPTESSVLSRSYNAKAYLYKTFAS